MKSIWILLDNRAGSRHQAEGIANYLNPSNINVIYKELEYTKLAGLPNFIRGKTLLGLTHQSKTEISVPYPDIVLSSTRRTAPIARYIKKQHPNTKLVQLGHIGRTGLKEFDLVFTPEHDKNKIQTPNIHYTIGCPHFVTKEKLHEAYQEWRPLFANLPHPITALIIGGAIKKKPFTIENAEALAKAVANLKEQEGGSLLITTSRRTGAEAEKKIMSYLEKYPHYAYLWGSKDKNPYLGFLACADNLVVTGDSVSMCSEATATEKDLRIFIGTNWLTPKHLRFVRSLFESGYAFDLEQTMHTTNAIKPPLLNTAKEIAETISNL